jgi:hypothetical protein
LEPKVESLLAPHLNDREASEMLAEIVQTGRQVQLMLVELEGHCRGRLTAVRREERIDSSWGDAQLETAAVDSEALPLAASRAQEQQSDKL